MNRLFKYHAIITHFFFYKDLREFRYLRLMRTSVSSTREPMKSESRPSSEQGLASAVSVLALHLKRLFDKLWTSHNQTERQRAASVTKEGVGIHVLPARSLFGDGIPRRLGC